MIRVSSGTAAALGLSQERQETLPTIAYLMMGERCRNACAFCAQGSGCAPGSRLSRVFWPSFPREVIVDALAGAFAARALHRACIQVVTAHGGMPELLAFVAEIRARTAIPLSVSVSDVSEGEMRSLADAGVTRAAIPLDAATPELFASVKGADWDARLSSLRMASRIFPGGAATHLIAGLGESEKELIELLKNLNREGITAGLFAFTPLRGTPMAHRNAPELASYRRLQVAHFLVREGSDWTWRYEEGRIVFEGDNEELARRLGGGSAFRTTGCDHCNRPYYNESPRGPVYNYPRPLTEEERRAAIRDALGARR